MTISLTEMIGTAIEAHGAWSAHLREAVQTGKSRRSGDQAACHKSCAFGTWLESPETRARYAQTPAYQVIHRLHRQFHAVAGDITDLINAGDLAQASALIEGDMAQTSERLVRGLMKWRAEEGQRAA